MRKRMKTKVQDDQVRHRRGLWREYLSRIGDRSVPSQSGMTQYNQSKRRQRRIMRGQHPVTGKPLPQDAEGREYIPAGAEDEVRDLRRPVYPG